MGKLVLFLADGTTLDIPLEGERITIGRRPTSDVCLPYRAVSAEHAVVVPVPAGAVIEDLGSTNGTFVNGKKVPRQLLRDGDQVEIGRQKFVYVADSGTFQRRKSVGQVSPASAAVDSTAPVDELPPASPAESDEEVVWDDDAPRREPEEAPANAAELLPDVDVDAESSSMAEDIDNADAALEVLTGHHAGRVWPLFKDESLVGRPGVQVAAVRRSGDEYRLVPVEGEEAPRINGAPIGAGGAGLRDGDMLHIAGVDLAFTLQDAK